MKNRISKIFVILGLIIATTIGCYAFSFRNMTLDFVQISDTHITERQSTPYKALGSSKELLRDAIEQINNIVGLDFVLFTGDMVDSATDENFYNFYKLLSRLKYPSLNTFGNHEFYGDMTKEQVLEVVKGYNPNYIFNDTYYAFSPKTDFRIVVLDATIKDNKTATGELPKEQLLFLDNELALNQDKVVVIAMHHAPVEPFVAKEHAINNANEFNEILLKYKNPIVVLSGHYHATKIRQFGNLVFVSTPSMVTYPMGFRHIKITNYKDRVVYNFDFLQTRLEDIKEDNRQSVISYATLAGFEKDRNTQFIFNKKHSKSARYKRNKIKNTSKVTKTSKREIKKLTQTKTIKTKKEKKSKKQKNATPKED
ncbi:MAG: metallophosphoesterase [Candidatus Gastranaerophilales bacterium]|nr:metallophosphoesterase [Candidatus Gastranaerophilales bacterium]